MEGEELNWEDLLVSPDAGPEAAYARLVLMEELDAALDELPDEQREVFLAHEFDGRSFKEVAAETGVSVSTLLSRKHYAVLHLRRRPQAVYDEFTETRGENMNGENMRRNWVRRRVERGVRFAMFGVVAIIVFGFVVKGLWNWLMLPLFGLHRLTFWQALGLLALSWILFGGLRGGLGPHRRRWFRERWEEMTPEQREKVRAGITGHCREVGAPLAEQKD